MLGSLAGLTGLTTGDPGCMGSLFGVDVIGTGILGLGEAEVTGWGGFLLGFLARCIIC